MSRASPCKRRAPVQRLHR